MTFDIAAVLFQDGVANGAVYVLLATVLVLVFTVTRIVFVPQGDLIAFSALTLAAFEAGHTPGTVWILALGAALALILAGGKAAGERNLAGLASAALWFGAVPAAIVLTALFLVPKEAPLLWKMAVTCALITCLGPILYRLVFEPIAAASPLVLLIAAVAAHFGLSSIGLHVFGAEGVRTPGFAGPPLVVGDLVVTRQTVGVIASSLVLVGLLSLFFRRSLSGKALLAAAHNRRGAELIGVSATAAGRTAFIVAGLIGAISGILIGPMTTLYYDSGFILGLKGFVGAIVGALAIYPLAALGALLVGLVEAFASFWASAYRDVIVFTLITPVLFWRSLASPHVEEEAE
ncbi:branched-chain amino acid ABC transporter permease [Chelatococcus reniformis]|uniref:Branched-chain amino acid ABC transporter permease n=1 Tax=Chelatococcus reniformis TaxID=1494448 RepID=A0A916UVK6_9HYPH|nr:branched-chain amino acid ABC transporter permease [Chelatococcus reniformis]GGC87243.1 branched-chain amino acid ABC transporter permease [Chelatococcus reniformis]